jgi:hypothetical protein
MQVFVLIVELNGDARAHDVKYYLNARAHFKNQASFKKFQAFDLESIGHAGGMFDLLSVEVFDVIKEFSKVTKAQL